MQEITIMRWDEARCVAYPIRLTVFVHEQGVPEELELDDDDLSAWHAVVFKDGQAIATGRLLSSGKIGRLAVLRQYRGQGVGTHLLQTILKYGKEQKVNQFFLHAQASASGFYERIGFKPIGPVFNEAGIDHIKMVLEPT
jgi:predicted GNAT family N-acyltransferase